MGQRERRAGDHKCDETLRRCFDLYSAREKRLKRIKKKRGDKRNNMLNCIKVVWQVEYVA